MHETRELARFVAGSTCDSLPEDTIRRAKERLLDLLGGCLFASAAPWSKMVRAMVVERTRRDDCTLWAGPGRADPAGAALANGTLGQGYELDDVYFPGSVHPGCVVVPAALAAGEQVGASGRQLLAAIVLGYEVMARAALAHGRGRLLPRGWHVTALVGPVGAAAAVGWLYGLGQKELLNAFGIAASMASGLMEFTQDPEGTMVNGLHGGRPAESGIVAADLARRGFTGPATALEGRFGMLHVYSDGPNPALLPEGLGQDFAIRCVATKPYASCASMHSTIQGLGQILGEHGGDRVRAEDIQVVELGVPAKVVHQNMVYRPRSVMSALFSAPFSAALALAGRGNNPSSYVEENLEDPEVLALAAKVQGHVDAEMEALYPVRHGARIRVVFADGTVREAAVRTPKGSPENPFTGQELEQRFDSMAGSVLGAERCAEVRTAIGILDSVADVRTFARLLAG